MAPVEEIDLPTAPDVRHFTPPTSDESRDGRKALDDAGSSSELSDLEFDDDPAIDDVKMEDLPEEQPIEPDHYDGGIPVFKPTMAQFQDFQKYMHGTNSYGMKSGIVLIDPPQEWKNQRKALDEMVKTIKVKNPISQEFHGNQGYWTQRNMEKQRSYNLPQWKALCEESHHQPPAKRGERRLNQEKPARSAASKPKSKALPMPDGQKRKPGRPRVRPVKGSTPASVKDEDISSLNAPPTPTSPEADTPLKTEATSDAEEATPTKPKRGRPAKGSQSKARGGEKATTVAARRQHNRQELNDIVDEAQFENFDYRTHNHDDWTSERCAELETSYWKSLTYNNPMYGADMPGSLFDDDTKVWNVAKLPNILDVVGDKIPGVNTAYLYLGMWKATFAWHLEDMDLYSINYIHFGAPKQWYSISQADARKFEAAMKDLWGMDAKNCDQFLRHKTYLVAPSFLKSRYNITVNKTIHREGQFVVTFPYGYHSGYNLGYNCAESVNFAIEDWLQYGSIAKKCNCEEDSVFIDFPWLMRQIRGEPEPMWIEETDDEDDDMDDEDGPTDLPTPPGSDKGKVKPASRKRKRGTDGKDKPKIKRLRLRLPGPKREPCMLCPNDSAGELLLDTDNGKKAHRLCALYTSETFITQTETGEDIVRGVSSISKDRLDLKCQFCRQKKGSKFQCSQAKCAKAYHATCAAMAGVQVDMGDIPVFEDGIEYIDVGLDFRCKMHRTVKRYKGTSEDAQLADTLRLLSSESVKKYAAELKKHDVVQFQMPGGDVFAGMVVDTIDSEWILVNVLPIGTTMEVEKAWLLFVDDSTTCLPKPSKDAKPLPAHLAGRSNHDMSDRKPTPGDPFTEGAFPTKWDLFQSTKPPVNPEQKKVDMTREEKVWYYIGNESTESKPAYTEDPAKWRPNPKSSFLDSVAPPRPMLMAPPVKRQSLPASHPTVAHTNARNAAMWSQQRPLQPQQAQQAGRPYEYKPRTMPNAQNYVLDSAAFARQQDDLRRAMHQNQWAQGTPPMPGYSSSPRPLPRGSSTGVPGMAGTSPSEPQVSPMHQQYTQGQNNRSPFSKPSQVNGLQHMGPSPAQHLDPVGHLDHQRHQAMLLAERQRIDQIRAQANAGPYPELPPGSSSMQFPAVTPRHAGPAPTKQLTMQSSRNTKEVPDHIAKYPYLVSAHKARPEVYVSPYASNGVSGEWLSQIEKGAKHHSKRISQDFYQKLDEKSQRQIREQEGTLYQKLQAEDAKTSVRTDANPEMRAFAFPAQKPGPFPHAAHPQPRRKEPGLSIKTESTPMTWKAGPSPTSTQANWNTGPSPTAMTFQGQGSPQQHQGLPVMHRHNSSSSSRPGSSHPKLVSPGIQPSSSHHIPHSPHFIANGGQSARNPFTQPHSPHVMAHPMSYGPQLPMYGPYNHPSAQYPDPPLPTQADWQRRMHNEAALQQNQHEPWNMGLHAMNALNMGMPQMANTPPPNPQQQSQWKPPPPAPPSEAVYGPENEGHDSPAPFWNQS